MRTVKIRRWEDMAEEFDFTRHGNINTAPPFVHDMREYCGETITVDEFLCYDALEFSEEMFEPDSGCMTEGCGRKQRKGENMCTACTIAALRFELTKAQEKIVEYRRTLVRIEAKGLGATATAGYICSNIAEMALKQGDKT